MRRQMISVAIGIAAAALILASPGTAAACSGGPACGIAALIQWEHAYYMPGDVVRGDADVTWPRRDIKRVGGPAEGPYRLYLSRLAPDGSPRDRGRIDLGLIELDAGPGRRGVVHVEFVVPEVPNGRYVVHHCDAATCKTRLGDLADTPLRVVATEFEERSYLVGRIESIEDRILRTRSIIARTAHKGRKAVNRVARELESTMLELEREIAELRAKPAPAERDDAPRRSELVVLGLMLGAASAYTLLSRRVFFRREE